MEQIHLQIQQAFASIAFRRRGERQAILASTAHVPGKLLDGDLPGNNVSETGHAIAHLQKLLGSEAASPKIQQLLANIRRQDDSLHQALRLEVDEKEEILTMIYSLCKQPAEVLSLLLSKVAF